MSNKNLTEMVFVLDRSGSMSGLEDDTIGGYNGLLEKQKKEEGEAVVTTVLFDDKYELLYDRADVKKIAPLTEEKYFARGTTALLDAVGRTVDKISAHRKTAPDREIPEKTMFVIITDGYENASREYSMDRVREMIEEKKEKENWEFLFLGANIDAIRTASKFGIGKNRAVRYEADGEGTRMNFEVVNSVVSCLREERVIPATWKESIENHFKKKHE